jgi:GNAT superfamily N-acetyltransferase
MNDDTFELIVEDDPDPDHDRQLRDGLNRFNAARVGADVRRPLGVFCRQRDRIVGGVVGYTQWQWLFVSHLWVDDVIRRQGSGRQLMRAIEDEGRRRGCRCAWLDTFSFQALDFYEAIGYRQFGELTDFPPGHTRHFLWKPLGAVS